jgi:predicted nucleic acid-binding protein
MSAEFIDTNVLVYAHDRSAGAKYSTSVGLLKRIFEERVGALSTQVLSEFYDVATRKLRIKPSEAAEAITELGTWNIHRPSHADLLKASRLHRHHKISWWDALILNSAHELDCSVLWSEDFTHGRRFGSVTVRNPFADNRT